MRFLRALLLLTFLFAVSSWAFPVPLIIGVPAVDGGLEAGRVWSRICRYLKSEDGVEVGFRVFEDHAALLENLYNRFVDAAFLDPVWSYRERGRVSVLLGTEIQEKRNFTGLIIVPKNSISYRLEDLRGASLALTRIRESCAGYYLPLALLAEARLRISDLGSVLYTETFESVLKGVSYGGLGSGIVPSYFLSREKEKHLFDSVRIIAESRPLPLPALVYRTEDGGNAFLGLKEALLAMKSKEKGRDALLVTGFSGFVPPGTSDNFSNLAYYMGIFERAYGSSE